MQSGSDPRAPRLAVAVTAMAMAILLPHPAARAALPGDGRLPEAAPELLQQLFWAILFFALVSLVGILWVGLVRHQVFRQTAEMRRREAAIEDYYRDLFENSQDLILSFDLRGRVASANKAAEWALGRLRTELIDRDFAETVAPAGVDRWRETLSQVFSGNHRASIEVACVRPDGQPAVLELNLRLQLRDGQPFQVQAIGWDITPRTRAEQALRRSERRLRESMAEREQLGMDLHDGIIQSLYAVGLGLQECRRLVAESPARADLALRDAISGLNSVIREVRSFITTIDPTPLSSEAFVSALESMAGNTTRTSNGAARVLCEVDATTLEQLPQAKVRQLLQIGREAVSNSLRHAGAETTRVTLGPDPTTGETVLRVLDAGTGFDPGQARGGRGLANMRTRAAELGADLDVRTSPGHGTEVTLRLPASSDDPDAATV